MHAYGCREPAVMHLNNWGLRNLYGSAMFHYQRQLALFLKFMCAVLIGSAFVMKNVFHN